MKKEMKGRVREREKRGGKKEKIKISVWDVVRVRGKKDVVMVGREGRRKGRER